MTINELLVDPIFDLPKDWRTEKKDSYYQLVIHTGKAYLNLLDKLEPFVFAGRAEVEGTPVARFVHQTARLLWQGIQRAMVAYFNHGSPGIAYAAFAARFESPNKKSWLDFPAGWVTSLPLSHAGPLYRIVVPWQDTLSARDMLHIPFEKRALVRTLRYSISGYPCIYAATSVHLAYKELRSPSWAEKNLTVGRLGVATPPSEYGEPVLMDLRNRVQEIRLRYLNRPNSYDSYLLRFLITWPLIMATSVPVDDADNFHEEYVIPQLFLQWVNRSKFFSGVAFSSSRVSPTELEYTEDFNVVIPVHHSNKNGLCNVRAKQLALSEPISYTQLQSSLQDQSSLSNEQIAAAYTHILASRPLGPINHN